MGENAKKLRWNENGLEDGSELLEDIATVAASLDPVVPVTALDVNRYTGRWYQVIYLRLVAPLPGFADIASNSAIQM